MKIFLTSDAGGITFGDGEYTPCAFDNRNRFTDRLKAALPESVNCLLISSDPDNDNMNDGVKYLMTEAFRLSGFMLQSIEMCDRRNSTRIKELIAEANLIILCGGHVPTQNRFFKGLDLSRYLKNYHGVLVGISAGSMNSAALVYAQPEEAGEATDPDYEHFITGLGLTDITILPHYQTMPGAMLDGLRLIEDISIPDSHIHPFYALPDGSYVYIEDNKPEFCGEYYCFSNGVINHYT